MIGLNIWFREKWIFFKYLDLMKMIFFLNIWFKRELFFKIFGLAENDLFIKKRKW